MKSLASARRAAAALALLLAANTGPVAHAESIRLEGAIVHTVSGPSLTNAPVLLRDGRIAAVGPDALQPADQVVSLSGLHLFPGLVAPVTVLGLVEIDGLRAARDTTEVGDYTPDVHAWIAVNPDSELIPVARANGFTHAQAVPSGGTIAGHSSVLRLDGWTIEDLAVRRACGLHLYWPSFGLDVSPRPPGAKADAWKSPEDQVKERDKKLREIDEFVDQAFAYDRARTAAGLAQTPPLTLDAASGRGAGLVETNGFRLVPAWEGMLQVLHREEPVFLHADDARQIESAVAWAVRRGFKAVLAGGRDAARVAPLLATNKVPVIYEHVFTQPPRDIDPYDVQFAAPTLLHKAGVEVSFSEGTDRFGASSIRNVPYAAAQAMAFGLPRIEAWRGLTLYPARALGLADRLGSIEPGKDATLVAVSGDILDLRVQVSRLWIGGREQSLASRHTRLYEKFKSRPAPGR
jgi:imidazolonepropionase-like amidohydrolase